VRPLTGDDADEVADVFARSRTEAMPWLPVLHTPEEDRRFFADTLRTSTGWGAEEDGALVGFAIGRRDWLDHLYVDPSSHGRGIGSALLARVVESSAGGLQLWAFERNEAARAFYRRHGFVEVERTDGAANEERTPDVRLQWGLLVRPATPADAEGITSVHVAAWRAGYAGLVPDVILAGLDPQERLARWRKRLADGAGQVLVGVEAGQVVGFLAHGAPGTRTWPVTSRAGGRSTPCTSTRGTGAGAWGDGCGGPWPPPSPSRSPACASGCWPGTPGGGPPTPGGGWLRMGLNGPGIRARGPFRRSGTPAGSNRRYPIHTIVTRDTPMRFCPIGHISP
jgi:GNAT superfamily N-acetyltransferase